MVGGPIEVTQETIRIVGREIERPVLLPFALWGEKREKSKCPLVFGRYDILFEVTGENENVVTHSLENLDPLLRLQRDSVDVTDASDYYADFHIAKILFSHEMSRSVLASAPPFRGSIKNVIYYLER
jgi:hypothetical protein